MAKFILILKTVKRYSIGLTGAVVVVVVVVFSLMQFGNVPNFLHLQKYICFPKTLLAGLVMANLSRSNLLVSFQLF